MMHSRVSSGWPPTQDSSAHSTPHPHPCLHIGDHTATERPDVHCALLAPTGLCQARVELCQIGPHEVPISRPKEHRQKTAAQSECNCPLSPRCHPCAHKRQAYLQKSDPHAQRLSMQKASHDT